MSNTFTNMETFHDISNVLLQSGYKAAAIGYFQLALPWLLYFTLYATQLSSCKKCCSYEHQLQHLNCSYKVVIPSTPLMITPVVSFLE